MTQKFTAGQSYRTSLKIDASVIQEFADLSGDRNPIHLDAREAQAYGYSRQVAHGGILLALLSSVVGMEMPGPGAVLMEQSVEWVAPVLVGDEVELVVTVAKVSSGVGILVLDVQANNQRGERVMNGEAKVKVAEKLPQQVKQMTGESRVALVTGGSRGIGAAIARQLGSDGVAVAVNYVDAETAALEVVGDLKEHSPLSQAFRCDLTNPDSASEMVNLVIQEFGRLDIIVHGASPMVTPVKVQEISYSDIRSYLDIYLGSGVALSAAALPGMVERGFGRFIFLGTSYMFGQPPDGMGPYVIAKEALWGLVKSMATELGQFGITTNMVSPGITDTGLIANLPARYKEVQARTNPSRRLASPEDTAALVAFLASEAAGFINGANMPVAGGPQ